MTWRGAAPTWCRLCETLCRLCVPSVSYTGTLATGRTTRCACARARVRSTTARPPHHTTPPRRPHTPHRTAPPIHIHTHTHANRLCGRPPHTHTHTPARARAHTHTHSDTPAANGEQRCPTPWAFASARTEDLRVAGHAGKPRSLHMRCTTSLIRTAVCCCCLKTTTTHPPPLPVADLQCITRYGWDGGHRRHRQRRVCRHCRPAVRLQCRRCLLVQTRALKPKLLSMSSDFDFFGPGTTIKTPA